jgi:chitin synthase
VHSYVLRNVFENAVGMTRDGISLPAVQPVDNSACIELLRGAQLNEKVSRKPGGILGVMNKASLSYKAGDQKADDMLKPPDIRLAWRERCYQQYCCL